jgi:hypothetical protein
MELVDRTPLDFSKKFSVKGFKDVYNFVININAFFLKISEKNYVGEKVAGPV